MVYVSHSPPHDRPGRGGLVARLTISVLCMDMTCQIWKCAHPYLMKVPISGCYVHVIHIHHASTLSGTGWSLICHMNKVISLCMCTLLPLIHLTSYGKASPFWPTGTHLVPVRLELMHAMCNFLNDPEQQDKRSVSLIPRPSVHAEGSTRGQCGWW